MVHTPLQQINDMSFFITKYSGEKELFNIQKFGRSLKRAGASAEQIKELIAALEQLPSIRSTHDIYQFAFDRLKATSPAIAARYNIKKALFALGPSGFPFEKFVAQIFKEQGYHVKTGQIVAGFCVDHEIDVIGHKPNHSIMVECKFHNQQGLKSDVKVPLYVKARFDDVAKKSKDTAFFKEVWLASNTKFTTQAIQYASCAAIKLLGFSYPEQGNLADLIDQYNLHPITALTSLTLQQKQELIKEGFVLCKDAFQHKGLLKNIGLSQHAIDQLLIEAHDVCSIAGES